MGQIGSGLFSSTAQNGSLNLDVGVATGATTTLNANNDFYRANAASNAMSFIFPDPSTVKGKVFTLEKVDTTFNVVTLNDGGNNVTTLNTQGEAVQLVSDGASYQIFNRRIPSVWVGYTTSFLGFGTVTPFNSFWRRSADSIDLQINFTTGTNTGVFATAALPVGLSFSLAKIGTNPTVGTMYSGAGANNSPYSAIVGTSFITLIGFGRLQVSMDPLTGTAFANSSLLSLTIRGAAIIGWNG